nr:hypothetical protein [Actinoplanes subtropicus]
MVKMKCSPAYVTVQGLQNLDRGGDFLIGAVLGHLRQVLPFFLADSVDQVRAGFGEGDEDRSPVLGIGAALDVAALDQIVDVTLHALPCQVQAFADGGDGGGAVLGEHFEDGSHSYGQARRLQQLLNHPGRVEYERPDLLEHLVEPGTPISRHDNNDVMCGPSPPARVHPFIGMFEHRWAPVGHRG